jgi:hypothetical protein
MFKLQMWCNKSQVTAKQLKAFDLVDTVGNFWEELFNEVSEGKRKHNYKNTEKLVYKIPICKVLIKEFSLY